MWVAWNERGPNRWNLSTIGRRDRKDSVVEKRQMDPSRSDKDRPGTHCRVCGEPTTGVPMPGADVYHLECILATTEHLRIKTVKPIGPPIRLIGETSPGIEPPYSKTYERRHMADGDQPPHDMDIECYRNVFKSHFNHNPTEYPATQREMDEELAKLGKMPREGDDW